MCFVGSFTVSRALKHSTRGYKREPYHGQHHQPEEPYHTDSPSPVYQQRSPLKPIAQETPDIYARDTNGPKSRRCEFTHRMPSTKRGVEPNPSSHTHIPYFRKRSSCRVLEDRPGHIALEYQAPRQPPPPMIRRVSPRTTSAAEPASEQQPSRTGSLFHESSLGKSSRATRPRRTSTTEQMSLRRQGSAPAGAVEIHHPRASESQEKHPGTRKVRFQREVDDIEGSKTRRNVDGPKKKSYPKSDSFSGDVASGYDDIQRERDHRRRLTARDPSLRTGGNGAGRLREIPRRHTLSDAPHARPQIIHDGHRQISERGVRVFRDSRPRNHTAFQHRPGSPGYRRPRFDSGDETVHNSRSRRRPYWRWRWD